MKNDMGYEEYKNTLQAGAKLYVDSQVETDNIASAKEAQAFEMLSIGRVKDIRDAVCKEIYERDFVDSSVPWDKVGENQSLVASVDKIIDSNMCSKRNRAHIIKEKISQDISQKLDLMGKHEKKRPHAPTGIFAIFKTNEFKKQKKTWEQESVNITERLLSLSKRKQIANHHQTHAYGIELKKFKKENPELFTKYLGIRSIEEKNIVDMKKYDRNHLDLRKEFDFDR